MSSTTSTSGSNYASDNNIEAVWPIRPANTRTPFNKPRLSINTVRKTVVNRDTLQVLEGLLKTTWTMSCVSPLFTWSVEESKLKRYARRMAGFLSETLPIEDGESFEVKYKVIPNLRLVSGDNSAVRISVNMTHEDERKQKFKGYLLSWGIPKSAKCAAIDETRFLPLFLLSGSKRIGYQVSRSLEKIHDCVVSPIELHESDRKELFMAVFSYLREKDEILALSYRLPNRPEVGSFDVRMSTNITSKLTKLVTESCGENVSFKDVDVFWDEINKHIHGTFEMRTQMCEMVKLSYPDVVINPDKFKVSSVKAMHVVLIFLTNKAVLLHSPFG